MRSLLLIPLLLFMFHGMLCADDWHFVRTDFTFENDADVRTDRAYTEGAKIYALIHRDDMNDTWFKIPFTDSYQREHFISFTLGQQMFSPDDLSASEPVIGQQAYAGWLYFQTGLHQSSEHHLDTLSLKLGILGQHAYMEQVQQFIHWLIGSPKPEGWGNQLGSKPGVQLDYLHKWRYELDDFWGMESDLIPYVSGEFGNVAIEGSGGTQLRMGYNLPKDYGDSPIDEYGNSGILASKTVSYRHSSHWSYYLNFGAGASAVLYDYFLDGTTLNGVQFVEKYYGRAFASYGATLRYKAFALNYIRTHYTPLYTTQNGHTNYGSLQFVYKF